MTGDDADRGEIKAGELKVGEPKVGEPKVGEVHTLTVDRSGERADRWLTDRLSGVSRRAMMQLFDAGRVRVAGRRAKKGQRLEAGQVVAVEGPLPDERALRPVPEPELPLTIAYRDEALVVLAKPPGMPTHPLRAGERGTLANALVARHPECATAGDDPREGGFAHRLDAGTSGLLAAARDHESWLALRRAFHEGRVVKEYLALVIGELGHPGTVEVPIAHDRAHPGRALAVEDPDDAARHGALPAATRYEPAQRFRGFTLLRCRAETGRMHQVRVHLAHLGWPVVGDELYGIRVAGEPPVVGHFLHAARLVLPHPRSGEPLAIEAPMPPDRLAALAALEVKPS